MGAPTLIVIFDLVVNTPEQIFIESQHHRANYAKEHGYKIGFVQRTRFTNRNSGPCPHYLPKIVTENFGRYHKCEQCGLKSGGPIVPYQFEF